MHDDLADEDSSPDDGSDGEDDPKEQAVTMTDGAQDQVVV